MNNAAGAGRHFLFLQGPHGPFFQQLGRLLRKTEAHTTRVGFNAGDQFFWREPGSYLAFDEPLENWPAFLQGLIERRNITDVVLYGDTRPVHREAIAIARKHGLWIHVFEEGYLRPYWVTYERDGSNGNSRLMELGVAEMRARLSQVVDDVPEAPDHWGDMREHVFYGAFYHWFVMFANRRYRHFRGHRNISVTKEFRLYFNRLLLMPVHWMQRMRATRRIKRGGFPYHLALLQLEHDASFRAHSPFTSMTDFLALIIKGFAEGAPQHHHLVFKAHPLEDGRAPLTREIARLAREHGLENRVHFVRGGKLAYLLDGAETAATVNSTSGEQALWRGLPLITFGAAVYAKPEFVSRQPIAEFYRAPSRPDTKAYRDYRRFLLATSQVAGGFYAARSRRQLLRKVTDMMLRETAPYEVVLTTNAASGQQLRVVK